MPPPLHILSVKRSDAQDGEEVVLLRVENNGPQSLDIGLLGTEGANPYYTCLKHDVLNKYQAKAFKGTADEWLAVMSWVFVRTTPEARYSEAIKGVELVAAVVDEQQITVTLRQSISGITQRLGTITLDREDEQEIELFDWTSLSAVNVQEAEQKIDHLQKELQTHSVTIEKMKAQMEDFLRVKNEHENQMLERFSYLLNAKKLKIRDQQKLLAGATVSKNAATQAKTVRGNKSVTEGNASKRKARSIAQDESEEELDGDFQTAELGAKKVISVDPLTDEEFPGGGSPHRSDEEDTDIEDDFEIAKKGNITSQPNAVKEEERRSAKGSVLEIPLPRKLPFNIKQPTPPAMMEAEDTDDEL